MLCMETLRSKIKLDWRIKDLAHLNWKKLARL